MNKQDESDSDWFLLILLGTMLFMAVYMTGCTVRGGWPRFLRPGESPGWHAPSNPVPNPATNGVVTNA